MARSFFGKSHEDRNKSKDPENCSHNNTRTERGHAGKMVTVCSDCHTQLDAWYPGEEDK